MFLYAHQKYNWDSVWENNTAKINMEFIYNVYENHTTEKF